MNSSSPASNTNTGTEAVKAVITQLTQVRVDKGLRQIDVANTMGVGQPSVSEFERGETNPRLSTLVRYAAAVGINLNISLDNDDKDN